MHVNNSVIFALLFNLLPAAAAIAVAERHDRGGKVPFVITGRLLA